jgi:glycerol-3-phosphate acyltransferase PlsX
MTNGLTIAIDAMGGDSGPEMVMAALEIVATRHPGVQMLAFGDEARLTPLLARYPKAKAVTQIRHASVSISMDEKPSQALRKGKGNSSMWLAAEAVKSGEAQMAVSAGNTGALMALSSLSLRTIPGVRRPAIAAIWPTLRGETIVLDVGANVGADAETLVDYAIMGEAMARCLFGIDRPTVGLLNIGVEEAKGVEEVKEAARLLRDSSLPIEYAGFVEGGDIGRGTVDVVVTEGYTGNIALKTAEGTAHQVGAFLKQALKRSWRSQIGALLARDAFAALKAKMDPKSHNGGVFLGLNGIVVKSHGGSDAEGFASAVALGVDMARNELVGKIKADIAAKNLLEASAAAADKSAATA